MAKLSETAERVLYGRWEIDRVPEFMSLPRPTKKLLKELINEIRPAVIRVRQLEVQIKKLQDMLASAGNEKDVVDIYGGPDDG